MNFRAGEICTYSGRFPRVPRAGSVHQAHHTVWWAKPLVPGQTQNQRPIPLIKQIDGEGRRPNPYSLRRPTTKKKWLFLMVLEIHQDHRLQPRHVLALKAFRAKKKSPAFSQKKFLIINQKINFNKKTAAIW